jgi:mannose-6-phosphate isomerase-like protein (cupin superfamily)
MDDLQNKLRSSNKVEELYGGEGIQLRVAVQHEKGVRPAVGEVHDASDDVFYVLEGTATLRLGGTLVAPREVEPGEWRGSSIEGGKDIDVAKGDLIVVPRGTPHQRNTVGKDFTMLLVKIYASGLPAKQPKKPAPASTGQKP